jgi:phosphatidyl-N-methylethanolamine N-methyltransferase
MIDPTLFAVAAVLLSLERICYVWAWRGTGSFLAFCASPAVSGLGEEPVAVLERLFYAFKALQLGVFASWFLVHGQGSLWPTAELPQCILGTLVIAVGQTLNLAVFFRLGRTGVFYGNRFGHSLPRCEQFPFSILRHPQYVGTVLSIWGLFLMMRFPHGDWFVLPMLETIYYVVGSHLES